VGHFCFVWTILRRASTNNYRRIGVGPFALEAPGATHFWFCVLNPAMLYLDLSKAPTDFFLTFPGVDMPYSKVDTAPGNKKGSLLDYGR
jgi:hypothetical protein